MKEIYCSSIFFIFFIFFIGCTSNKTKKKLNVPTIYVIPNENSTILFSDFFESGEIISINTKDTIVSNIWRIYPLNNDSNKFLLWAKAADYIGHILDKNSGKLTQLIKKGQAPGECIAIGSMFIDNDYLNIYDRMLSKIFIYSQNGNLLKTIKIPNMYHDCLPIDNSYMAFYNRSPQKKDAPKIYITNREDYNVTKSFLSHLDPNVVKERHFQQNNNLYKCNDTVCFFESFSNTIYNIFSDKVTSRYVFECGKYKIPDEVFENKNLKLNDFVRKCINSSYVWNINDFFESENFIFFSFSFNQKKHFAFYNKKNGECISSDKFHDNVITQIIEKEIPYHFSPIGVIDDCIYFTAESYYLMENLDKIKTQQPEIYQKIINNQLPISKVYNNSNLESNPIIIKYKFRK